MPINTARGATPDVARALSEFLHGGLERANTDTFIPYGPPEQDITPLGTADLPTSLNELSDLVVRSYDLSISSAMDLSIPVVGTVAGGLSRRVIVLERAAFKRIPQDAGEDHWGYALRLCLTVNKWNTEAKLSLPFLAASAELGTINAQWTLQIMGLAGPRIQAALVPPTELNVETFVIAKQSLEKIIEAVNDSTTVFVASRIAAIRPTDPKMTALRLAAAGAYALSSIERGRSFDEAIKRIGSQDGATDDAIKEVYGQFELFDSMARPSGETRTKARDVLGRVRADV